MISAKYLVCFTLLSSLTVLTAKKFKKEGEKPAWAKKDIRDYSEADLERLLDQWEEDEEPLEPDELPEHLRPQPQLDLNNIKNADPEELMKLSKKGRTLMTFVKVSGNPTKDETETLTKLWQTSLWNNHIQAERYLIEDDRAIFMYKDGSQAWTAKDYLIEQERCDTVTIDSKVYEGKYRKVRARRMIILLMSLSKGVVICTSLWLISSTLRRTIIMLQKIQNNLLYVISYVDVLAVSLIIPLFNQHLQSIGISNVKIGLLGSIYSAVQFFASPIIGHMSDIYGSKRVLIVTLLICSICYPVMGQATAFIPMLLIRSVIGFVKHTQLLCKNHIQEGTTDEKEQFRIFGNLNGFTSLGYIVGPVIAGYLIDTKDGYAYMCCVTGILFALNGLISYYLKVATGKKVHKRQNTNFITSFKQIPWTICWDIFLLKCLAVFAMFSFYLNYHTAMTVRYGTTSVQNGYSLSLQGLVRALAAFFIQKIFDLFPNHLGTSHKMQIIYGILIATFSAMYLCSSFYLFLVLLVPLNVCLCFIRIVNHDALVDRIRDHQKGIILGAFNNVTAVCRFILPLCSGYIVDVFGYDGSYLISILSLVIGLVIITMYSVRQKID